MSSYEVSNELQSLSPEVDTSGSSRESDVIDDSTNSANNFAWTKISTKKKGIAHLEEGSPIRSTMDDSIDSPPVLFDHKNRRKHLIYSSDDDDETVACDKSKGHPVDESEIIHATSESSSHEESVDEVASDDRWNLNDDDDDDEDRSFSAGADSEEPLQQVHVIDPSDSEEDMEDRRGSHIVDDSTSIPVIELTDNEDNNDYKPDENGLSSKASENSGSVLSEDSYCSVGGRTNESRGSSINDSLGLGASASNIEQTSTLSGNVSSRSRGFTSDTSVASIRSEGSGRTMQYLSDPLDKTSGSPTVNSEIFILRRKIADKTDAYRTLERAYRSCNPKKLKDGGQLLQERKAKCMKELEELKSKLEKLEESDVIVVSITKPRVQEPAQPVFTAKDQVTTNFGKKALETHKVQRALTVDALHTLHHSLDTCPTPDQVESDPEGLKVELMHHQKHGLAWLLWRERQTPHGGILADDMGLGKTLTMISLVLRSEELLGDQEEEQEEWQSAKERRLHRGNTLVVCPATLIGQWEGEVKRHCHRHTLKVLVHHGSSREVRGKPLTRYDLVITTYGIVSQEGRTSEGETAQGAVFRVNWKRIILDEAHAIRNPKTKVSKAVCELNGIRKWCLTGTPVHNKELDFYALLKFLQCSPFDDLAVWKQWVDNKSAIGMERLNLVVKSILLRRTKQELKAMGELEGLPTKDTQTLHFTMDEEELRVYTQVLQFSKTLLCQYLQQKEESAVHGAGLTSAQLDGLRQRAGQMGLTGEIKAHEILVLLLRLRQICCLPGLIQTMLSDEEYKTDNLDEANDGAVEDLVTQVRRLSVTPRHAHSSEAPPAAPSTDIMSVLTHGNPVFDMERPSKKIQVVLDTIREILYTGDKVVVVSQWSSLLHIINSHVKTLGARTIVLDGKVPVKNRSAMIDDFNRKDGGPRIMLLTLTVGGVGLNLVGANRLIIFEPHWNPQLEAQACDRVYRVGQRKPVTVYKVICENSIEDRIEQLQKKKLELAENVLRGEAKRQVSKLTLADLKSLFDIPNKT